LKKVLETACEDSHQKIFQEGFSDDLNSFFKELEEKKDEFAELYPVIARLLDLMNSLQNPEDLLEKRDPLVRLFESSPFQENFRRRGYSLTPKKILKHFEDSGFRNLDKKLEETSLKYLGFFIAFVNEVYEPGWPPEKRPVVAGSKPASGRMIFI